MGGFIFRWLWLFICVWDAAALPKYGKDPLSECLFAYAMTTVVATICIQEWIDYFVKKLRNEEEDGD